MSLRRRHSASAVAQEAGSKTAAAVRGAPGAAAHGIYATGERALDSLRAAAGYVTGTARHAAGAPKRALDAAVHQLDEGFHKVRAH